MAVSQARVRTSLVLCQTGGNRRASDRMCARGDRADTRRLDSVDGRSRLRSDPCSKEQLKSSICLAGVFFVGHRPFSE